MQRSEGSNSVYFRSTKVRPTLFWNPYRIRYLWKAQDVSTLKLGLNGEGAHVGVCAWVRYRNFEEVTWYMREMTDIHASTFDTHARK